MTYPFGLIHRSELGGSSIVGRPSTKGDVIIGDDVWSGADATILSGVTIGAGAVVAACAVVVNDVERYAIVGENPAKEIARRFDAEIVGLLMQLRWLDLPEEVI